MKKILGLVLILVTSCATFQSDLCCDTEVVYLDEIKDDSTNLFTSLEFNTITLDFRPLRPRFFYGYSYGYWHTRPLWLDFDYWHNDFYYSNFYSYHYPYYSYYYRPWNMWDWYMRPWRPANNWYQGPFNNPSYNVVYNASRRNSITNLNRSIATAIANNRIENANNRPIINIKPIINTKPIVVSNSYKPTNNNYKPSNNNYNSKPNYNYKPSNNYKPSSNSRSTYSSSGSNNNYSRSSAGSASSSRKNN
jgi:hypothetical protein